MRVNAYAALTPGADVAPYEDDAGGPGPLEVDVEVTHCGVCNTDLLVIDNDWGARVSVVAGHEVGGVVRAGLCHGVLPFVAPTFGRPAHPNGRSAPTAHYRRRRSR